MTHLFSQIDGYDVSFDEQSFCVVAGVLLYILFSFYNTV